MAIWLEIHCDVRRDGMNKHFNAICWGHRNESPGGLARNASAIRMTLLEMEREAVAIGWVRKRGKWTCPGCARES